MIDQSLLQSNFIGRDGFRWWIGQIPPIESQGKQTNGGGWGNRCKVRIMGYHPYNNVELKNEDLPWAQVLLPTTSGSGAANYSTNPKLRPGDVVFGFFLDGDNGQNPVIMGLFGRTSQVPSNDYVSPFVPFTGYTDNVADPNGKVYNSQTSESNSTSQKSPRDVPPKVINKLNSNKETKDEIAYYSGVGKKIVFANTCDDTAVKGIITEVTNLLDKVSDGVSKVSNIAGEISRSVEKIVSIANNIVGQMFNSLFNKLIPLLKKGLQLLFKTVFAKVLAATLNPGIAHLAGVAAQTAMINPVKKLEEAIPCVAGKIVSGLGSIVKNLLKSVLDNVENFVTCAGNQFSGAFMNGIINKIVQGLAGPLNGVKKLLSLIGGFNVANFLRSGIDSIKAIGGLFDCNQSKGKCSGLVKEWTIGSGAKSSENEESTFKSILDNMNVAAAVGLSPYVKDVQENDSIVKDNYVGLRKVTSIVTKTDNTLLFDNLNGFEVDGLLTSNSEIMKITSINPKINQISVERAYSGISTNYDVGSNFSLISPITDTTLSGASPTFTFNQEYGQWDIFGAGTKTPATNSPLGGCYTGKPTSCGPPKVRIFGGGGSGGTATAILGNFANNVLNNNNITEKRTASIIGVRVDNAGSGYRYPPFVEFVDNCNQGYGAVARSIINDAGEIVEIYMVSEGENYPLGDVNFQSSVSTAETNPQYKPYGVVRVAVINGGIGYNAGDVGTDNYNNTYNLTVDDVGTVTSVSITLQDTLTPEIIANIIQENPGLTVSSTNTSTNTNKKLAQRQPINSMTISDLPVIKIKSKSGVGAIVKPIVGELSTTPQGELKIVVDCIT